MTSAGLLAGLTIAFVLIAGAALVAASAVVAVHHAMRASWRRIAGHPPLPHTCLHPVQRHR